MSLSDYQYTYRDLTLGDGTSYDVAEIDGLEGFASRAGDRDLPRGHGSVPGKHFTVARQFVLSIETLGEPEDVEALNAELHDTFAPSEDDQHEFKFKHPGRPERMVRCRPVQLPRVVNSTTIRLAPTRVAMLAADPRIYSSDEHTVIVPLYTPSGGGTNYPKNYPINWAAGVVLEAVASNDGTADAFPTLRFYGPTVGTVTGVVIANQTTGESLTISASIASGQILTFDGTAWVTGSGGQIVGLDGATRYGDWEQPREALRLIPGDNVLRFTLTGTSTDARAAVSWRHTWLS